MAFKFIVTKQGKEALESTNPNDFIMHSDYNAFQIIAEGVVTAQTVDADPKTFTVAHNLGYIPAAFAFAKFPDGFVAAVGTGQRGSSLGYQRRFYLQVDDTNIYLIFYQGVSGNYDVSFKYYIFNSDI